jgi:polysaccharide biosynthesis/export protein
MKHQLFGRLLLLCAIVTGAGVLHAQGEQTRVAKSSATIEAALPADYGIGTQDVLTVVFWREKDLSADVVVRPDGKISLPLLNDVQAAGYTPEQLSGSLERAAAKFVTDPDATVIVREINSRKVFVIGEVAKTGAIRLVSDMNVLQLLAEVGGLLEHANRDDIVIVRQENGRDLRFKFSYDDVIKGRKLEQNILLKPGDTVVVR